MYVTLTSVVVKKNPVKQIKFWYWAVSLMKQADSMSLYGETTTLNGERLVLAVWNDPQRIREFIASEAPQQVMQKKVMNDVCSSTRFYAYQTDRLPTWEEASRLLNMKGEAYYSLQ
jgi:hypothetical protein